MVLGRSPLIAPLKSTAWLLVWAVAVFAVDGAVIVRRDDDHTPSNPTARAAATTTSTASTSASASTTSLAGATTTATTIAASERPTSTVGTGDPITTTSIAGSGEVVVAHLQGDADTPPSSAGYHVEGRWQLRWRVDQGNGVAATVTNDDVPNDGGFFVPMKPSEDSFEFTAGCNCTLHLTPDGSIYDVLVVDVEG